MVIRYDYRYVKMAMTKKQRAEKLYNLRKKSPALAVILSLLITAPAAYAISKFDFRIRYVLVLLIFFTRMVPEVSIALPVSISFIRAGLFDTTLGLTLAHLIRILPITCFILVGVFSAIPPELERQALIDGATRAKAFFKVALPLSLGGLSVAGIFSFL